MNDFDKLKGKKILIYGLNAIGKSALVQLLQNDIYVDGFLTEREDATPKNIRYLNKPLVYIDELDNTTIDYIILNASNKNSVELSKRLGLTVRDCPLVETLEEDFFQTVGDTKNTYLHYVIECVRDEGKRLILCGSTDDVLKKAKIFSLLDTEIDCGISSDGLIGTRGDIVFISPYDLLYVDQTNYLILVLPGTEHWAQTLLTEAGLEEQTFIRWQDIRRLDSAISFDPNLGYNIKDSVSIYRTTPTYNGACLKIGILGGSTSDAIYFYEKSWIEHLTETLSAASFDAEIYSGGVRGYTVSQELVKFLRDMAHLKLDAVISYSGVNEAAAASVENSFVSKYQREIFIRVAASNPRGLRRDMNNQVCYGWKVDNLADNWIEKERMMHAVAKEFGTKFYAILQPSLLSKSPHSDNDIEVMEHWFSPKKLFRYEVMNEIRSRIHQLKLPWLVDFSAIFNGRCDKIYFDGCHLLSNGNRLLAERVFELIRKDLIEREEMKGRSQ